MEHQQLEETLKNAGLTDYESKVYLALLELGESTTTLIIKKIGTHIGRIYEILDALVSKGLASELQKNGVKYYTPASPEKIIDYLHKKKGAISEQEKIINQALPQLQGLLSSFKQTPHVEIFVGFEGMQTAFQKEMSHYSKGKEVLVLGVATKQEYSADVMRFFTNKVYSLRKKIGIKVKKINDISAKKDKDIEPNAQIRYLEMNSTITINVFENISILIVSYNPIMCIVIEDKNVADGFRSQFENLWTVAKK